MYNTKLNRIFFSSTYCGMSSASKVATISCSSLRYLDGVKIMWHGPIFYITLWIRITQKRQLWTSIHALAARITHNINMFLQACCSLSVRWRRSRTSAVRINKTAVRKTVKTIPCSFFIVPEQLGGFVCTMILLVRQFSCSNRATRTCTSLLIRWPDWALSVSLLDQFHVIHRRYHYKSKYTEGVPTVSACTLRFYLILNE